MRLKFTGSRFCWRAGCVPNCRMAGRRFASKRGNLKHGRRSVSNRSQGLQRARQRHGPKTRAVHSAWIVVEPLIALPENRRRKSGKPGARKSRYGHAGLCSLGRLRRLAHAARRLPRNDPAVRLRKIHRSGYARASYAEPALHARARLVRRTRLGQRRRDRSG